MSRRNFHWVLNARNAAIYKSEFVKVYFTCRAGMMINPQILEISFKSVYVMTIRALWIEATKPPGMTHG